MTIVVLKFFITALLNHCHWELNECSNLKICKCWSQIKQILVHFHPLEVVGRGGETQLQVGENLNLIMECNKDLSPLIMTVVVLKFFITALLNHCHWELNEYSNLKICKCWSQIKQILVNFHPLEVVGRGGETQLPSG